MLSELGYVGLLKCGATTLSESDSLFISDEWQRLHAGHEAGGHRPPESRHYMCGYCDEST